MTFDPESIVPPGAKIKVIGVGGGGGNAVNTMIRSNLEGVDFICTNTDIQALRFSLAPTKIQVGKELTKGLGAGADPDIGRDAALEDRHEIQAVLEGADMVFITAGMGGGTGTGGAAVIAQIARELGALTVAVVTKPFGFEGKRRRKQAELGIARLRESVDTLITIPNKRLLEVAAPDLSMVNAFRMADEVLVNAVKGISDIINIPGTVNVDFADVKTVMSCMGQALMGIGGAEGENRASLAAQQAIKSPLLEDIDIEGATGILLNITAGENVTLMEVNEACSVVQEAAHEDANFIFGAVIDESLGDEMRVTVIATGFPVDEDDTDSIQNLRSSGVLPQNHPQRLTSPTLTNPLTSRREFGSFAKSRETIMRQAAAAPAKPAQPHPTAPKVAQPIVQEPIISQPEPEPVQANEMAPESTEPMATETQAPQPVASASYQEPEVRTEPESHPSIEPFAATPEPQVAPLVEEPAPEEAHFEDMTPVSETEELAHATLGQFEEPQETSELVEPLPGEQFQDLKPLRSAHEIAANRIEGATVITDPEEAFDQENMDQLAETDLTPSVSEGLFSDDQVSDEDLFSNDGEELDHEGAPLDALFGEENSSLTSDIDQRIDEALELAERMKSAETQPSLNAGNKDLDEDLDVPAFLRNGMRDLPLT
jgi:cell division protein FtsZ